MSDPNDPRPLRVFTFPDRPDAILIYVPDGQELWLPRMRTPFNRYDVAMQLGGADIPAAVRDTVPGRFTHAMKLAVADDRATRGQMEREREAARCVEIKDHPEATTYQQKRAALVLAKSKIDDELRDLKVQIGRAKSRAATTGQFLPVAEFRAKESRIVDLQTTSLAIQKRLGDLRRQEAAETKQAEPGRMKRFIELSKRYLSREQYQSLWAEVDAVGVAVNDEKAAAEGAER